MADFRIGKFTIGYSIRAYMAFIFSTVFCYLTWLKIVPVEAFVVTASLIIKAYFDTPKEIDSPSNEPDGN
jgi:hypothetical protein